MFRTPNPQPPANPKARRRTSHERCAACLLLAALLLTQIAAALGYSPRLGASLNGVRRAASQLSRKLHNGEYRLATSRRPAAVWV